MSTLPLTKQLKPFQPPQIVIDLGDQAPLVKLGMDAMELATAMTVDSVEMAAEAQAEIATWARASADVEVWRKNFTVPIDAAKKSVMDFVRPATEKLEAASDLLKRKCAKWQTEEREKVERARRAAEEIAAQERARAAAEARAANEKAETERRKAEEAQRAAAQAQDPGERQRLEGEAQQAAANAERHADDAATSSAISQVIVASAIPDAPRVAGMRFGETTEVDVEDMQAFVCWCAANPTFVHLLKPDTVAIKAAKKAMKDHFNPAGVRFTKEISAGRGSKAA